MIHFSLHRTRTSAKECAICGAEIPVRRVPDYAEYWRVAGGDRSPGFPRIICCACHALFDLPTDGWTTSAAGRALVTAKQSFDPSQP